MEKLVLRKSILIDAPVGKVWQALIDPAIIKQYFFGTNVSSGWKVGSSIVYTGEWEGKTYEDKGTILDIVPEKLLKHDYFSNFSGQEDIPENYQTITYELEPKRTSVELTVTQENFKTPEAVEHSGANWESILNQLKQIVEAKVEA